MTTNAPARVGAADTSPARIESLDLARGIAILGTLATNIWIFTNPEGLVGFINERTPDAPRWGEVAETWLTALVNGKFLGLLTLMFGVGVAIQHDSARRRGSPWPGRYRWRATLLFADAVVHYFLVTEFDILMGYAITGVVLAYVLLGSPRLLTWVIGVSATIHVAAVAALAWLAATTTGPRAGALSPNPYADGSFWDLVVFRADNLVAFRLEPVFITFYSLAMFGAGARLYRAGVFEPDATTLRRRLMLIGGPALVLDVLVNVYGGDWGFFVGRYGLAGVAAAGLLAAIAEYGVRRRTRGVLGRPLLAVGRTALTCYVATNVLAGAVCYGWGLGLADSVPAAWRVPFTLGLAMAISAVLLLSATLWLRRFAKGPLEWLWAISVDALARDRRPEQSR